MLLCRAAVLSAVCVAPLGCCWPQRGGLLSEAVMDCRQLSSRAASAMQRNDYAQAESLLAQAVDRCGTDPEARQRYATVLWQRGERDAALAQLDQAIELAGGDAALLVRRGQWHLAMDNVAAAHADAEAALDGDSSAAAAWLLRARLGARNHDLHEALAAYHRVLALEPHHREALWEKAQLHWALSCDASEDPHAQLYRAFANVQVLLERYPPGEEPVPALCLAGRVQSRLGRHEDASRALAAAIHRSGANAEVWHELAEAQFLAGRYLEARASAHQALVLEPHRAPSQELLQRIELAQAAVTAPRGDYLTARGADVPLK
jgi:tetratricopeptide (TPR) repeat protein